MSNEPQDKQDAMATEFGDTGAAVEDSLPVGEDTLFQVGSTTKTFTATALVRLFDQRLVDLDAQVPSYVPEFRTEQSEVGERDGPLPAQPTTMCLS